MVLKLLLTKLGFLFCVSESFSRYADKTHLTNTKISRQDLQFLM